MIIYLSYLRCLSNREGKHVLKEMYEGCAANHAGSREMVRRTLRAGYFWPTMNEDAKELVRKCERCQKHGSLIHLPADETRAMYVPCPFAKWGMNLVGPFPLAKG